MTAQSATIDSATVSAGSHRPLLGLGTVIRKELTEWVRGPKALIILGVSVLGAIFMTMIPFIAEATSEAADAGLLSHDPTANVLLGWTGQVVALIAILSTMALLSTERDRGTLEVGKVADMTVLSADIMQLPVEEIPRQHALMTIIGGEVVYQAK